MKTDFEDIGQRFFGNRWWSSIARTTTTAGDTMTVAYFDLAQLFWNRHFPALRFRNASPVFRVALLSAFRFDTADAGV